MKFLEFSVVFLLCFIPLGIIIMWDLPGLAVLAGVSILLYFLTKGETTDAKEEQPSRMERVNHVHHGHAA